MGPGAQSNDELQKRKSKQSDERRMTSWLRGRNKTKVDYPKCSHVGLQIAVLKELWKLNLSNVPNWHVSDLGERGLSSFLESMFGTELIASSSYIFDGSRLVRGAWIPTSEASPTTLSVKVGCHPNTRIEVLCEFGPGLPQSGMTNWQIGRWDGYLYWTEMQRLLRNPTVFKGS
ncbi:unnamed protein product [Arabis nemorensis]|uniref:Uncharacterized protein n=1 Tax=Arabis nemorensis TaxID=586526 RepID=A0A565AYZ9_9BRAS|nr:unnamed protein product [Arabis nemorensis]